MAEIKLYKKINTIKFALSKTIIKKTGKNKFAGYEYMELGDILPVLVGLMNENGVFSKIDFNSTEASMTLYDVDSGETVVYTSPMSSADLKGVHAVQNLGAVQTYLRRYFYINAFDIVENDVLDPGGEKGKGFNNPSSQQKIIDNDSMVKPVQDAIKVRRLFALAKEIYPDKNQESYKEQVKTFFKVSSFTLLDNAQLDQVISGLEKKKQ